MNAIDTSLLIQGSPEWLQARVGSLGASHIGDIMARTKTGWGASRTNVMSRLIAERLTGKPVEEYVSPAMQHGIETEAEARADYEFMRDKTVVQVGLVRHPTIIGTHASPDGQIDDDGLIEIKCPTTSTHIGLLLGASVKGEYVKQMNWQMEVTGRKWCDFISYDPRLPGDMSLFVKHFDRDDELIEEMRAAVVEFISELDDKVNRLREKFGCGV